MLFAFSGLSLRTTLLQYSSDEGSSYLCHMSFNCLQLSNGIGEQGRLHVVSIIKLPSKSHCFTY